MKEQKFQNVKTILGLYGYTTTTKEKRKIKQLLKIDAFGKSKQSENWKVQMYGFQGY